ncbi:MAG: sodium:alanine symporter family protein [Corynebacterium sp.]|nr:sodium:alanine symporter family protein [Corynebacterium sp.]
MDILNNIDSFVWGPFFLIPLLLGTGLWLTIRLRGIQFWKLGPALRHGLIDQQDKTGEGDISNYQALTTALAATVGTGNIVGVATAISVGGPGSLFWMWVTGLVGMMSKYSEAFLAVRFRDKDDKGEMIGGPQLYLKKAIGGPLGKVLATSFAIFAVIASFGIGNLTQANSVAQAVQSSFGVEPAVTGIIMFVAIGAVLLGGIQAIGKVTAGFVPMMIILYIFGGTFLLIRNASGILPALGLVFSDAFTGSAATGGFVGSTIMVAIRMGVARGIFSNESGMGSAAIAAAAAQTTHPVRQGLVSMTQTFIDTIIVVTFTGLCIITMGTWDMDSDQAAAMTAEAFTQGLPGDWGHYIVSVSLVFFAFSTIIGWSYYGERSLVSLVGLHGSLPYRIVFTIVVFIGSVSQLEVVWTLADVANGLMALPNLIGLLILSGLIARETKQYLDWDPKLRKPATTVEEFTKQQLPNWV